LGRLDDYLLSQLHRADAMIYDSTEEEYPFYAEEEYDCHRVGATPFWEPTRNLATMKKPRGQHLSGRADQADDKAWVIWLWLRYMLTGYVRIRAVNEEGTWVSFACPSWERAMELHRNYRERGHRRNQVMRLFALALNRKK
jgi:hypothetical protein